MTEYDFTNEYDGSDVVLYDAWVGTRGLPVNFKLGHMREPLTLDSITSSRYIPFIERSLIYQVIPLYNMGVMASGSHLSDRVNWSLGVFKDGGPDDPAAGGLAAGRVGDDDYSFTGRLVGTPWYEDDGRRLLHVGASGSYRQLQDSEDLRFRVRPEAHFANRYADTGTFGADALNYQGVEAASVFGPLSLQAEVMNLSADHSASNEEVNFQGWYAMMSYFLTGEHRPYKGGAFQRVKPNQNFSLKEGGGWGAWEMGLRYSSMDLDDGPVAGGELNDLTLGLNWYLNPNARIMWNVVSADSDAGEAMNYQMRLSIDF